MRASRVLAGVALAAAAAGGVATLRPPRPPGPRAPADETTLARNAAVRAAFAGPAPPGPVDPQVAGFFARLTAAVNDRDGVGGAFLFEPARLLAAVRAAAPDAAGDDAGATRHLNDAAWQAFVSGWLGDGWQGVRVRRVDPLPGDGEVVAYVRHDGRGGSVPARWWLTRRAGELRAYDVEDVRLGVRLSQQVAGAVFPQGTEADQAAVEAAVRGIAAAQKHLADRDPVRAVDALAPARAAPLPPAVRVMHALTEGAAALGLGRTDEALVWAARADDVRPATPGTDLLRAAVAYRLGAWAEAAERAGRFVDRVGPDPQASLILGRALLEQGKKDDAAKALRAAVAEFPGDRQLAEALKAAEEP